ncbi:hypothetical protein H3V53_14885 [Paraburkholderia bengalensis]|uniref:Uncharacterized protein n=1 Tax=Paraburkholderia bengalensis TaxID=2747562 RepID=A0ABU8ISL6_9BURK
MTYHAVDWEAAAQEAAFDGLCFCMLSDGRFINRQAMPDDTPHRSRFTLSAEVFEQHIASLIPEPHASRP